MRESLQRLCDTFIENREIVKKQFKMESSYLHPICANIFCAKGVPARSESLADAKALLREKTGVFSNFRGNLIGPISAMLAAGPAPERRMDHALENYKSLRELFWPSEYLALSAFLLADMGVGSRTEGAVARGRRLYDRMRKEHPFLTSAEDCVFAVLMAFSEQSDDQLIADMEACYRLIKTRFSDGNSAQSVSHVLALSPGTPEEKTARLFQLYDSIGAAGGKYGRYHHLSTLAAVSVLEGDVEQIVRDILDVDAFLSGQKGYGVFGLDRRTRTMHAAMLVSDDYCAGDAALTALLTGTMAESATQTAAQNAVMMSTLAMLAAQQAALSATIAASSASNASNAH